MIKIEFMKPFYTKASNDTLRLVFAYQYFTVKKEDEVYHFIPIEGKEILVDLDTHQVKNLSEVFVFQRGNRFMRLPLYQLLLVSNMDEHLTPIIKQQVGRGDAPVLPSQALHIEKDVLLLIEALEKQNIDRLMDQALEEKNEELFYKLLEQKE